MNQAQYFPIIIFLLVVFRVTSRAYSAYKNDYKTWPILAGLAVIYTILAVMRFLMGLQSPVFLIMSLVCYLATIMIYRSSKTTG